MELLGGKKRKEKTGASVPALGACLGFPGETGLSGAEHARASLIRARADGNGNLAIYLPLVSCGGSGGAVPLLLHRD
jgi:hypothetical protein